MCVCSDIITDKSQSSHLRWIIIFKQGFITHIVLTQQILPSFYQNKYIDLERSLYFKHTFYIFNTCYCLSTLITVKYLHVLQDHLLYSQADLKLDLTNSWSIFRRLFIQVLLCSATSAFSFSLKVHLHYTFLAIFLIIGKSGFM